MTFNNFFLYPFSDYVLDFINAKYSSYLCLFACVDINLFRFIIDIYS
jgi:hypothetical protein